MPELKITEALLPGEKYEVPCGVGASVNQQIERLIAAIDRLTQALKNAPSSITVYPAGYREPGGYGGGHERCEPWPGITGGSKD